MSRRRIEAGAAGAGSFSLRAISTPAAHIAAAPAAAYARGVAPPAIPSQVSLSFKFDSLASRPAITATTNASPLRLVAPSSLPSNFFTKPTAAAGGPRDSSESMRLTAVVDDLSQRLRKATEAKAQLEGQVTRLNGALVQERSASAGRLQALKTEVATVQENEMRLRTELASRPAVREVDTQQKFATRVRSALEQEETNAKVADAEARLGAVSKRHESLTAEVKLLEGRKADALAATESALSAEEVDELVAKAAEAQEALHHAEDAKAGIEDDIAKFEAMRDAHVDETKKAEMTLFKANEATAAAVVDESAAKQQLQEMLLEHGKVAGKVEYMNKKLEGLSTAAVADTTFVVSGAHAPKRNRAAVAGSMAQVAALACCGEGVAYHFAHDAPINIGAAGTNAAVDPRDPAGTNEMITALVTDLQTYFQNAAADHAAIGRGADGPVAIGEVEAAA